jgi:mono/diheme cytochrome c family protein
MRFTTAAFMTLTLAATPLVPSAIRAQQPEGAKGASVWDGVYTAEQAKRGEATYQKECSSCHGGDLGGDGFAPALAGAEFSNTWNGATLGDLFERMRISMPPSNPDSVPAAGKADVLAFVLKSGKFPEGKAELKPQAEVLKAIQFQATKQ